MEGNQERMPIAHNVRNVLKLFRTVATSYNHEVDSLDGQDESHSLQELLLTLENENIRFKMWAGNLAAHQRGPVSLDHRLREAPHVQEQVLYLLRDLSESIEDTIPLITRREPRKGSRDVEDKPESFPGGSDQDSDDSFTDSDLDDDENISPETILSMLCTDIAEAIDCLLRLSVAIANPAPHERFRNLGVGPDEDVSFYKSHDVRYVQDKFPKISQDLPGVLGKFITRRRQFFKYRESHHAKLAAGLDQESHKDTSRTEIVPNTVASSLPEHFKGSGVIDEDNRSDMAMSETSYATSAGYLMLEDGEMKPAPPLKVPPRPPEADKGVFECPFCYRMITANTRGAWKRHVFGDLRPYTCLFSRCAESNTDFDRRHRWQLHVSQYHWRTWSCPFKCENTFPSAVELGDHIRHQHLPNASEAHLSTVVARGEVSVSNDVTKQCPLCTRAISGLKSYIKHVGRHLEQLALHALPKIEDKELKDDVESCEQNDESSELGAISVDNDSETSSKAGEWPETGETDNQVASRGPHAMTFGHDSEGEVTAGDTPMPPAASFISSGLPEVEAAIMKKLENIDLDIAATQGNAKFKVGEMTKAKIKAAVEESVEEYVEKEFARLSEQAQTGLEEHKQPPTDPSEEAGPAPQDSRPTYTRMSRRHISIETLRESNINFDFDADPDYVLVEGSVPEWEQDRLWEHTQLIREKRVDTLQRESLSDSGEPEYEWVRKKNRRQTKTPLRFYDYQDTPFLCSYEGCERAVPGNGFSHQWNLQDHKNHVHNDHGSSGDYSSQPGERKPSPPPRPPSTDDPRRIHVGTTSRERETPPSPSPSSPPPMPFNLPEMNYGYTDTTSSNPPERPAPQPVTYYWKCCHCLETWHWALFTVSQENSPGK
ncbi:transcription factor Cys6 [Fusarium mundagurra]|uniref:Transcription factor Cys6 n=1 Tax=Fusarium mundagurra TaxID=1567541 RepID=A0A8H5Z6W5_9HYPO|nr:transcription factor Cys6 [Fusarium mundagurra]